jgi:hypothetical protein
MAYLADGQHERAVECALRSLRENRTYTSAYRQLAMTPGLAGREDEAQALTRHLLELEPGLTVGGAGGVTQAAAARTPVSFAMLSRAGSRFPERMAPTRRTNKIRSRALSRPERPSFVATPLERESAKGNRSSSAGERALSRREIASASDSRRESA